MSRLQEILVAIAQNRVDIISTNVTRIKMDLAKRKNGHSELKKVLDRMVLPAYLLRQGDEVSPASPERPLLDLIEDIKTALNGVLRADVLRELFEGLLHEYESALDAFQGGDDNVKREMRIAPGRFTAECLDGVYYLLPPDLALRMISLNSKGESARENESGNSDVAAIVVSESNDPSLIGAGIHAKVARRGAMNNKLYPCAEADAYDLSESIFDRPTSAATTIGKVWVVIETPKGFETVERVVQIGESVRGELIKTWFELPQKYRWLQKRIGKDDLVAWLPWLINGDFLKIFLTNNPQYQNLTDEQLLFCFLQLAPVTQQLAVHPPQQRLQDFARLGLAEILERGAAIPIPVVNQFTKLFTEDKESVLAALALFGRNPAWMQGSSLAEVCLLIRSIRTLSKQELFGSWEGIYAKVSPQQLQWLSERAGSDHLYHWIVYLAGSEPRKFLKNNGYREDFAAQQLLLAFLNINYRALTVLSASDRLTDFSQTHLGLFGSNTTSQADFNKLQEILVTAKKRERVLLAFAMCKTWPGLQQGVALLDLIESTKVFSVIAGVFPGQNAIEIDRILLSPEFLSTQDAGQLNIDPTIPKFDKAASSRAVIESIVLKPDDRKTDNNVAMRQGSILYDVGIDRDRELAPSVAAIKGGHVLTVRAYPIFGRSMEESIDSEVVQPLIHRPPAPRMLDGLGKMLCRVERYDRMYQSGVLTEADLRDPESGNEFFDLFCVEGHISTKLDPRAIPMVYRTLRCLYEALLSGGVEQTHWQLLRADDPLLAQIYLTLIIRHIPASVLSLYVPAIVRMLSMERQGLVFLNRQFPELDVTQWEGGVANLFSCKERFEVLLASQPLNSRITYDLLSPTIRYKDPSATEAIEWICDAEGIVSIRKEEGKFAEEKEAEKQWLLGCLEAEFPELRAIIENALRFDALMRHLDPWKVYEALTAAVVYANTSPQKLISCVYRIKMLPVETILAGQLERRLSNETVAQALERIREKDIYEEARIQPSKETVSAFVAQLFSGEPLREEEFWQALNRLGAKEFDFIKTLPAKFVVFQVNQASAEYVPVEYTLQDIFYRAIYDGHAGAVAALVRCHGKHGLDVNRLQQAGPNGYDVIPLVVALTLRPQHQNPQVLKALFASPYLKKPEKPNPGIKLSPEAMLHQQSLETALFSMISWQDPNANFQDPGTIEKIQGVLRVLVAEGFDIDQRGGSTKKNLLELAIQSEQQGKKREFGANGNAPSPLSFKAGQAEVFAMLVNLGANDILSIPDLLAFVKYHSQHPSVQAAFNQLLQRNRFVFQAFGQATLQGQTTLKAGRLGILDVAPWTPDYPLQAAVKLLQVALFPKDTVGVSSAVGQSKDGKKWVVTPAVPQSSAWFGGTEIDPASYTRRVLMALATLPGNAEFVACATINERGDSVTELVPIGSEHAFVAPAAALIEIIEDEEGYQVAQSQLRTPLFCSDQVALPLSRSVMESFIGLDVDRLLMGWLQCLKSNGMLNSLPAGVRDLRERLIKMQQAARRDSAISALGLMLEVFPPELADFFAQLRDYRDPLKRTTQLFSKNFNPEESRKSSGMLALDFLEKAWTAEKQLTDQVAGVKKMVTSGSTAELKKLATVEAVELFLNSIVFPKVSAEIQRAIFACLTQLKLPLRTLNVSRSSITTGELEVLVMNSPGLVEIDISGCGGVDSRIVSVLARHCQKLQRLVSNQMNWVSISPQPAPKETTALAKAGLGLQKIVSTLKDRTSSRGALPVLAKPPITETIKFNNLRTWGLSGCGSLVSVDGVVALHLETLIANQNSRCSRLDVLSPELRSVELYGTPLPAQQVFALSAQSPALVLQGGVKGSVHRLEPRQLTKLHVEWELPLSRTETRSFLVSGISNSVLDLSGLRVTNDDVKFLIGLLKGRQVTIDVTGCPFVTPELFKNFENITMRGTDYVALGSSQLLFSPQPSIGDGSSASSDVCKIRVFAFEQGVVFTSGVTESAVTKRFLSEAKTPQKFRTEASWLGTPDKMIVLPNGDLVIATSTGMLELWDVGSEVPRCRAAVQAHSGTRVKVTSLIYSPRANAIISASMDPSVHASVITLASSNPKAVISASLNQGIAVFRVPDLMRLTGWAVREKERRKEGGVVVEERTLEYQVTAMALLPPELGQKVTQQDFVVGTGGGRLIVYSMSVGIGRPGEVINSLQLWNCTTEVRDIVTLFPEETIIAVAAGPDIDIVNLEADAAGLAIGGKHEMKVFENEAVVSTVRPLDGGHLAVGSLVGPGPEERKGRVDIWKWEGEVTEEGQHVGTVFRIPESINTLTFDLSHPGTLFFGTSKNICSVRFPVTDTNTKPTPASSVPWSAATAGPLSYGGVGQDPSPRRGSPPNASPPKVSLLPPRRGTIYSPS